MDINDAIASAKHHFLEGKYQISQDILLSVKDEEKWYSSQQLAIEVAFSICSSSNNVDSNINNLRSLLMKLHNMKYNNNSINVKMVNALLYIGFELCRLEMLNNKPYKVCIIAKETFDMAYTWLCHYCSLEVKNEDNIYQGLSCESLCLLWKLVLNQTKMKSNIKYQLLTIINSLALVWTTNLILCKHFLESKRIINMRKSIFEIQIDHETDHVIIEEKSLNSFEFIELYINSITSNTFLPIENLFTMKLNRTKIQNEILAYCMLLSTNGIL